MTKSTLPDPVPTGTGSGTEAGRPQRRPREDHSIAVACYNTVPLDEQHEQQAVEALTLLLAAWLKKHRSLPPPG